MNIEDLSKGNDAGKGPDDKEPPAKVAMEAIKAQRTAASPGSTESNPRGRRALPAHLERERIVHDLDEAEKHCAVCAQDLREFGEDQRAL